MDITTQQIIAQEVLSKIKALDSRAIIAGGAARDWYFNKLANDVDIFYYHENSKWCLDNIRNQVTILKALLGCSDIKVLGFNPQILISEPKDNFNNYLKNPDIVNVFETTIDGIKFQFIQLRQRNVDVNKFAYNMCQAWSDGVNINTTAKFKIGAEKKILIETGELYSNTEAFKQKMIAKFPDYSYISK